MDRIDSPEVRVVEASAGSGKTYCLALRYLKLLINPSLKLEDIPLNSICAITFSNKAALEMKERILEFLKRLALDKFTDPKEKSALLSYLGVSADYARKKAFRITEEIIRSYNSFRVQTIDSFINAILCGCAFKFGLSSAFRIKDNHKQYLAYSFDRLIDSVDKDSAVKGLFLDFLRQYLYVERKKGWFPKQDMLGILGFLFDSVNVFGAPLVKYGKDFKDIIAKRKRILELMLKLRKVMPEGANLQTWGAFLNSFDEKTGEGMIDRFFRPFSKPAFALRKGYSLNPDTLSLWQEIKDNIRSLREWEAFSLFNCYIDIFNSTALFFGEFSRADDVIFLPELNTRMSGLLNNREDPLSIPELYYRLAVSFRHFLIDEFQDTSLLQWKNLFPMVEEALSTGGTLFYVGDKKQAIYRFRGGDAYLMERIRRLLAHFNVKEEILSRNYRSQKEIVEFNNRVFSRENLGNFLKQVSSGDRDGFELNEEDLDEIAGVFREARQECLAGENSAGRVGIEIAREECIREKTISLVREISQRFAYQDIALLARSNMEVEELSSWLIAEGLPVESEKTLNIRENAYIKELTAFLRFLNSPIDNLAFASFILGDIFARACGLGQARIRDFLFRLSLKGGPRDYLYIEFRNSFPEIWKGFLEGFYKRVGFVPLYELVISIFSGFKVMENFPRAQGFFMRFLELIKLKEEEASGVSLFLEYFESAPLEELYVYSLSQSALKVMTIHKAKGLEFNAVVIPFLEMSARISSGSDNSFFVFGANESIKRTENRQKVIAEGDFLADDSSLRLVNLTKEGALSSPLLNQHYRDELKKALIDELNCVYVAFTRARYELYAFIPEKSSGTRNPAALLISPVVDAGYGRETTDDGRRLPAGRQGRPDDRRLFRSNLLSLPPSLYQDWSELLKDEFGRITSLKRRKEILKGEIRHYALSCLGNLLGVDADEAVSRAVGQTIAAFESPDEFTEYERFLRGVLSCPRLKEFFFMEDGFVYTEKELVDSHGNTRRIDRLVVKKDESWVIDYKSSPLETEEGKKQLREYMGLVSRIYPGVKVKGFLIFLDSLMLLEV